MHYSDKRGYVRTQMGNDRDSCSRGRASLKLGFALIDGLLFVLIVIRARRFKRRLDTFKPTRTVRWTLPATILTRVS